MSTLQIVSIIANVVLTITVLSLVIPKGMLSYRSWKKRREVKREQQRNAEKARLIKLIRKEVENYLDELRNG